MVRILVDAMFGKLGRFLRICGFDTLLAASELPDSEVMALALHDHRLLITRDKALAQHMQKQDQNGNGGFRAKTALFVKETDLPAQLTQVFLFLGVNLDAFIREWEIHQEFPSRCTECNGILHFIPDIPPHLVLPPGTRANESKYWQCENPACQKLYWFGRHWTDILLILRDVQRRMHDLQDPAT